MHEFHGAAWFTIRINETFKSFFSPSQFNSIKMEIPLIEWKVMNNNAKTVIFLWIQTIKLVENRSSFGNQCILIFQVRFG